jgi:hypothetical protein
MEKRQATLLKTVHTFLQLVARGPENLSKLERFISSREV